MNCWINYLVAGIAGPIALVFIIVTGGFFVAGAMKVGGRIAERWQAWRPSMHINHVADKIGVTVAVLFVLLVIGGFAAAYDLIYDDCRPWCMGPCNAEEKAP